MPKIEKRRQICRSPCKQSKKEVTADNGEVLPATYLFEYTNHSQILEFAGGVGLDGARAKQQ
jgi:hypothetical protein